MAIYKGTALVSQIIGKLGTQDFMRWKNKLVVRTSPLVVTDPHSTRQAVMRDALGTSSADWFSTLTADQRNAWESFAKQSHNKQEFPAGIRTLPQGNGGSYSGQNAFIMTNQLLASAGLSSVTDAPLTNTPPDIINDLTGGWNEQSDQIELALTVPPFADVNSIARIWIDSVQELFHKQIVLTGFAISTDLAVAAVNGALGVSQPVTDFRDSYVLICVDIVNPDGLVSGPSTTLEIYIDPL